jgi:micrococcal nuclease
VAGDPPGEPNASVVRVVDGDTIVVSTGGIEESVRLIGIDTPETVKPGTPVECFGKEASAHASDLLAEGTAVVLERDVEARDRYDRLLAYVYRAADGLFVNMEIVESGYGQPAPYPPNEAYGDEFDQAGDTARAAGLGLWGECGGDDLYG